MTDSMARQEAIERLRTALKTAEDSWEPGYDVLVQQADLRTLLTTAEPVRDGTSMRQEAIERLREICADNRYSCEFVGNFVRSNITLLTTAEEPAGDGELALDLRAIARASNLAPALCQRVEDAADLITTLKAEIERAYREGFRAGYCHRANGGGDATDEPETAHWTGSNARQATNGDGLDTVKSDS